jgi:two-component system cell cycle response regulator
MELIEWTDGLCIGVEVIDTEHKKILSIINTLSEEVTSKESNSVISKTFDELEAYADYHFKHEEELMESCSAPDIEDHKEKHRMFFTTVLEMKNNFIAGQSELAAEEIGIFLMNWLVNHIIAEDLALVPLFAKFGLVDKKYLDNSTVDPKENKISFRLQQWLNPSISFLTNNIKLKNRVLLSALIPTLVVLLLSLSISLQSGLKYRSANSLEKVLLLIDKSNCLIHCLQAERGLTAGIVTSDYSRFSDALARQRKDTDLKCEDIIEHLRGLSGRKSKLHLETFASELQTNVNKLSLFREEVDQQKISADEVEEKYSAGILHVLTIIEIISQLPMSSAISTRINAFGAVLHYKEANGLKRALGTKIIEIGSLGDGRLIKYSLLTGEQKAYLHTFEHNEVPGFGALWEEFSKSDAYIAADEYEKQLIDIVISNNQNQMDSEQWWAVYTAKADELDILVDQLVGLIENRIDDEIREVKQQLLLILVILVSVLLAVILFSHIISNSITRPIIGLTRNMVYLASGKRDARYEHQIVDDEIKQMAKASELCRISLVQSDIGKLERQYKDALNEINTLSGIVPICSYCKGIRDDEGYWQRVDKYVSEHSKAEFSHGICPDCMEEHYPKISERAAQALKESKE